MRNCPSAQLGADPIDAGETEVDDLDLAGLGDEHVGGFEVAVDDVLVVRGGERFARRAIDAEGLGERGARVLDPLIEARSGDVLHRDVDAVAVDVGFVDLDDGGVLEAGEGAGFLEHARALLGGRVDHLECDEAAERGIAGLVHDSHAAAAEHAYDLEAADPHGLCIGVDKGRANASEHRLRMEVFGHGGRCYSTQVRSDGDLLEAWRGGDRTAGDELIRRHFDSICRFFRAKLGDDVEDLIQKTFLDCVTSRDRVAIDGFRPYLFGVAKNRLYDHLRASFRGPQRLDLGSSSLADLGTSPSQHVARDQEEQLLLAAMRTIPVEFQIALELAYWENMSGPEIAQVLGIPANTVRSRLARARAAVRDALERLATNPAQVDTTLSRLDAAMRD